jgi:hypothetical protein
MGKRKVEINSVAFHVWDEDNYLQIDDVNDTELRRIWERIKTDYADYEKWFCYHNNETPEFLLNDLGAVLEDDCIEMRLTAEDLIECKTPDTEPVTHDNFTEFAAYHDACNPDMGWTSERIGRDLSRWGIFFIRSGRQLNAYILMAVSNPSLAEIYVVNAPDAEQRKALIVHAAKYAFEQGKNEILFQTDKNTTDYDVALAAGFKVCGFYKGYRI